MIYTLDTNFLIDAARIHFPINDNQIFWTWLVKLGKNKTISISEHVYDEINVGNDILVDWIVYNKQIFVHGALSYIDKLPKVLQAYGDIDEAALERLGADPYVIAHAIKIKGCVITREIPNNATTAHNKKVSSICKELNIPFYTFSRFMWEVRKTMP
jgi:hypothetical protein